jgi:hypothetical protein
MVADVGGLSCALAAPDAARMNGSAVHQTKVLRNAACPASPNDPRLAQPIAPEERADNLSLGDFAKVALAF